MGKYIRATPQIGERVFIAENAAVRCDVVLSDDVSIWYGASIRGDVQSISIGAGTNIQDNTTCHVASDEISPISGGIALVVGQEVTVGHNSILHACTIEDRCLIGMGAIIMDGAIIETETIVGAGSLVPANAHLERGFLYLGSPARKVRSLTEQEKDMIRRSADHYIQLKNCYLEQGIS